MRPCAAPPGPCAKRPIRSSPGSWTPPCRAANKIGSTTTPKVPTKDDAYEYLVDLGVLLDETDTPIDGRFVIVPAWFHGLLLKDERFVKIRQLELGRDPRQRRRWARRPASRS